MPQAPLVHRDVPCFPEVIGGFGVPAGKMNSNNSRPTNIRCARTIRQVK